LPDSDHQRAIFEWNATRVDYDRTTTLHELFEHRASQFAEQPAVVFEDSTLTYAQLNARANRLARALRERGIGPDVPVGVYLERSLEMVIALQGILKAGGAYLPLDPEYPIERLATIVQSSGMPIILTHERFLDRVSVLPAPALPLDAYRDEPDQLDESNLPAIATSADLAYIIYTSGSTGAPKGVMISHAAICNRLLWMQDEYRLTPEDRVLQKTPFSFDVSVWEFFWPLLFGGTLVVARPGGHRDPAYLVDLIRDERISLVHFVPSMLAVFLEQPDLRQSCRSLRAVFTSGEALPEGVARLCLSHIPARLHNLYGPTEAAVDVTYWECQPDAPAGPIPIGRPIANMRCYVLDAEFRPTKIGDVGELFVAGIGVARGYLGRDDLTAERFMPDPFFAGSDARMYRTGDRARWREDGVLEFLGRLDDQIKVRGFRIEPGEIEAALSKLSSVKQSVVVAREMKPGDVRLVAYIVAASEVSDKAIRTELARTVPDYMIPAAFVRLSAIPLSPNGKIDRKALPLPEFLKRNHSLFESPRNPTESAIQEIWQKTLGVGSIGIHDNFFSELGGDSLVAARAATLITTATGVPVRLRTLFDCPTIAQLALTTSPSQSAIATVESIERAADGNTFVASFAQEQFFFIDQLEGPNFSAYNVATYVSLRGQLDVTALGIAIKTLVDRHEPLRTAIEFRGGTTVQVVRPAPEEILTIDDLGSVSADQRQSAADRRARDLADLPFDLSTGPLIRATIFRLSADEHRLLVVFHHAAVDGWSLDVFWRELASAYRSHREGSPSALQPLPVRYADYALWQRRAVTETRLEPSISYWRTKLNGLEPLELPVDRPRPPVLSYVGERLDFEVPDAIAEKLREVCLELSATPFMVLLTAFQAVLARMSGREDLAVGVPLSGRTRPELDDLIGVFVNTVVLRADLSGEPSLRQAIAQTRANFLDAHDHQEVPFERLVQELRPQRVRNQNPLVQVIFQVLGDSDPDFSDTGLHATALPSPLERVRFDLELKFAPRADSFLASLHYPTDLFERITIERLAARYMSFLGAALAELDRPMTELPIVGDEERVLLLETWNATATELPPDATIDGIFERQARVAPNHIAIVSGGGALSYKDLDSRADRVAAVLRTFGAGPETIIAMYLPRSADQIVAILGILKAGAAYLPLDRRNPIERNSFMVRDSRAIAVITHREIHDQAQFGDIPTLLIDDLVNGRVGRANGSVLDKDAARKTGRTLAYVIYTSGSTGNPKGVMVEHRSVIRLVHGQNYATFGSDRVFLQLAPVAFDASTFEIWGPLLHGGKLVLPPSEQIDFDVIREQIAIHGVTTMWLTAGLFNEIVSTSPETLAGVDEILTGGEALSPKHIGLAYARLDTRTRIKNGYGPTECTTFACCHDVPRDLPAPSGTVPIGRPIANTTAYVLDHRRRLLPIGSAGELFLGGHGLARGYLSRPDLTAAQFVDHPFRPGERLYRTGDRVRFRTDGTLEFLGRLDDQLKIRGFRIEPGEIEAALVKIPVIRNAAVIPQTANSGATQLVAYIVAAGSISDDEIRDRLRLVIPTHMIPSAFLRLETLPLTSNGKVDRKALPKLEFTRSSSATYDPPRSEIERSLAQIWQELLGVTSIGLDDDFFNLGGHSILAVRLMARIKDAFGLSSPIATLLHAPTVRRLAAAIARPDLVPSPMLVALESRGSRPPFYCLPGAYVTERQILGDGVAFAALSRHTGQDYPFYGLTIHNVPDEVGYFDLIPTIAERAIAEIRAVRPHGPYLLGGHSMGGLIAFEMARRLVADGEEVPLVAMFDSYGPDFPRRKYVSEVVRAHAANLRGLPVRKKARYLGERLRLRRRRLLSKLSERSDRVRKMDRKVNLGIRHYLANAPRYSGRVDLFRASDMPDYTSHGYEEPTNGWNSVADQGVNVWSVTGGHVSILASENLPILAEVLRASIDDACAHLLSRN
jgi:amino acid adenylation domain-containing protein